MLLAKQTSDNNGGETYTPYVIQAAVVATFGGSVDSFKREVIPWIQYHLALGLYRIYAFYDSDDQIVINALKSLSMVHLIEMKASDYLSR